MGITATLSNCGKSKITICVQSFTGTKVVYGVSTGQDMITAHFSSWLSSCLQPPVLIISPKTDSAVFVLRS